MNKFDSPERFLFWIVGLYQLSERRLNSINKDPFYCIETQDGYIILSKMCDKFPEPVLAMVANQCRLRRTPNYPNKDWEDVMIFLTIELKKIGAME